MKKTLRFSLFIALLGTSCVAFSQISIGAKAGLNLANIMTDENDFDTKMLPTFQVGAVVEFGLTENIAIQTGASLQGKGIKYEDEFTVLGETFKTTSTATPLYIQVPAHVMYNGNGFFVGVGPYVGFGIAGKLKSEVNGSSTSDDINFGNTIDDDFSPIDFGVGAQAGVSFGPVRVGAGYDLGLADIVAKDNRSAGQPTVKNSVINIFASYFFGQ